MTGARTSGSLAPDPALVSAARWAGLAYALALLVLWLSIGTLDGPDHLIVVILFFLWQIAPAGAVALMVEGSRTRGGQLAFLLFGAALIGSTIFAYFYSFVLAPDPQMPIFLTLFLPLYQFAAFLFFFLIACLCGWRARDGWR